MSKDAAPMSEDDAKKLYERMMELETSSHATNEQLQAMHEQLQHLKQTITVLTELQTLTEPKETWIPIAPGAYVKGTVSPAATVLLSVGAGTAVEKNPAEVLKTLAEHVTTLEELADGALAELKEAHTEMETIKERVDGTPMPASMTAENIRHHGHDHDHHGHHHH